MATEALNHVTGVFDTLKPVFNAVPVVKNAIGLIAEIVELARQARQNKKDCAALSDRVSALQKVLEGICCKSLYFSCACKIVQTRRVCAKVQK